ncbi:MAG: hypothetical protein JXR94_20950 [Candidatus Hydrogenedentes bacterium]|nr:hypothetical protein [Candidatus Hydrogenedentota bacterium]
MIEAGDYSVVIPRLLHVVSKYPDSEAALDARYWMGVTYHKIQSYRDAIDMFNEYIDLAPDGKYAEKSAAYSARLLEEYEKKFWTADKLDTRIAELRKDLAAEPGNFESQWTLADLLWKRGDYDESGRIYAQLVAAKPEYATDATVTSRVELLPSGEVVVLSPVEVLRRAVEEQPLVVSNVSAFRSGADLFTREARYYVVTGQVTNRADSVLYGVQVIITLYGFGNVVYDTNTVSIGRLNPGDTRAFSVRFSNFENVENIHRHECIGTFER